MQKRSSKRNYIGLLIAAVFVMQIFALPAFGTEIEKSVDKRNAKLGEDLAYTIKMNFTETASNVTIADHLPAGLVYLNDSLNGTLNGSDITWQLGNVSSNLKILLNASINETYNRPKIASNFVNLTYYVNDSAFLQTKTVSDANGNYDFSDLADGDYTVIAVKYVSFIKNWTMGRANVSVENGQSLKDTDLYLTTAEGEDVNAVLDLIGNASVLGKILSNTPFGVMNVSNATVVILKEQSVLVKTISDSAGSYNFSDIANGDYTVIAFNYVSFIKSWIMGKVNITIENGQNLNDIELYLTTAGAEEVNAILELIGNASVSGRILSNTPFGVMNVSDATVVVIKEQSGMSKKQLTASSQEVRIKDVNEYTGEGNPGITFLLLSEADILLTKQAAERCGLNISVYCNYRLPPDLDLTSCDFVFVERLVTESLRDQILPMIEEAKAQNVSVVLTSPSTELSNVNLTEHPYILEYWSNRCPQNMEQLLIYIGVNFCGLDGVFEEPTTIVQDGIYHPDADRIFENLTEYLAWYENNTGGNHTYDPDNYTVGVTFWRERYLTGEIEIEDKIIRTLEERGINVIAAFQPMVLYPPLYPPNSPCVNTTQIFLHDGEPMVDAIIDLGFGVYLVMAMVKHTDCLEMLDVPIINGIELYTTINEWRNGTTGSDFYFPYHIPIMEIAGQIESIVVGGTEYNPVYDVFLLKPIASQIDWLVDRTVSWIDLSPTYKNNSEKNVAIIYYHHSVGKDSCLVAANLDVAPSIVNLLHAMNGRGYMLGDDIPDDNELLNLVLTQGRNIGMWVQEEINYVAENCDVALVPEDEYLVWFNKLPENKKNEVVERWGESPGNIMVYENASGKRFIVIPKITLGNILIAPQPSRAAEQNMTALYHDKSIPPTHQYIAFYYWLKHVYGADAIVSVGRHGTQEWLPGKGVGLSIDDCWPAILIQDMPVVYHYEVEGIGEGIMAKRRGNAVMIDHLTPVIVAAGLYGNLSNLEQTIPLYEREENGTLKTKYKEQILDMCRDLNLDQDLGIDLNETVTSNETVFEDFLEEIHDYLLSIKREYMPYGLHIIGKQVSDAGLVDMTKSLLGYEFRNYVERMNISEAQTRKLLEAVIINGTSPEDARKEILGTSGNVTGNASENMTVLARTSADSNGNYTFSNLNAGNYTVTAVKLSPVGWTSGMVNVGVTESEVTEADTIWLGMTEWGAIEDILNASIDPSDLTGVSSISGTVLAETPFGTFPGNDATVVIRKQDSGECVVADELTNYLNLAAVYSDNLQKCVIEIDRTLDALDGEYIIPGPSNDPIRNPEVLPSGRNFYGFDPNIVPTKPAWEVGKETIDQLLSPYYSETGAYPENIGFVMFSFNTMKDLGVLESEIFYLLGVEPLWDVNGNVKDVRLIPSEELGRPRIDVVVTMSGIYRENWPYQIELINKAVRIASESDDSPYHRNFVNESTKSTYQWLIENNYTESLAHDLSLIRIFGPPDGVWGVGGFITAIESSGSWQNESKLADLYLRNMGYVYSDEIWGKQYVDLFSQNLNGTEVAIFAWSSHSHSVLGIDHTFEFFGGLSMAIRSITSEAPDMYINNLKDPDGAKLETLSQVITRDLRSMYYNPYWIEGMMEHGYAGAREMKTIMANLWGWEVTSPDTITDAMWNEMYDAYVKDKYDMGLEDWFNENNPYALQSITARMLEAVRKGYWDPSEEVKSDLADAYQKSVDEYGVTCCGHTCGNPFINDYVSGILSAPMEAESSEVEQSSQRYSSGGGGGRRTEEEKGLANETAEVSGVSKMGEELEKPPEETGESAEKIKTGRVMKEEEPAATLPISGAPLMGLIAVVMILFFVGTGFWLKARRG